MHARRKVGDVEARGRGLAWTVLGALVALTVLGLYGARRRAEDGVASIERRLTAGRPPTFFHERDVEGLPSAARRYLLHAIASGTPLATHARIESVGRMRLAPGGSWVRFRSDEVVAPPEGFVWRAHVRRGPLRLGGHDVLGHGRGALSWWAWGLLPLVRRAGPEIDRSSAGRLALATVWVPSALLPSAGARWSEVDADTARVVVDVAGSPHELTLTVDSEGRLVRAHVLRWREDEAGGRLEPFGFDRVLEEGTFGGYRVPTHVIAGWHPAGARPFRFFEPRITRIAYG